jgi:hypothetical protein
MKTKNKEPAFPHMTGPESVCAGMSLRDYFAGQALAGLTAKGYNLKYLPGSAYEIADAMLKEREKES